MKPYNEFMDFVETWCEDNKVTLATLSRACGRIDNYIYTLSKMPTTYNTQATQELIINSMERALSYSKLSTQTYLPIKGGYWSWPDIV